MLLSFCGLTARCKTLKIHTRRGPRYSISHDFISRTWFPNPVLMPNEWASEWVFAQFRVPLHAALPAFCNFAIRSGLYAAAER